MITNSKRQQRVQTERPKVPRVYVSLVNPDDPDDREHFTAYETDVKNLKRLIVGGKVESPVAESSVSK